MKMNKTTIFILISFYVLCNAKKLDEKSCHIHNYM